MAYTVKSSERLRPSAADTETKALLYLMNFREDSEEIYYFVVDFFNDLTGMTKMSDKLWDLQSKGDKQPSPYTIGTELVTLYKNFVSEFEFAYYIIFLGGVTSSLRVDDKLTRFGISNVKDTALERIEISCMDCSSTHIAYESADSEFSFDISTTKMRKQILDAVQEKVDIYNEEIVRLTNEITICQKELDSCMETADVPVEALLLVKQEMEGARGADKRIKEIDQEIDRLSGQLEITVAISEDVEKKSRKLLDNIVAQMNDFYNQVDIMEDRPYIDIFTTRDRTYSGSEATEFHLARMYAFAKSLQHDYPIIVDSFRAEDLSSDREAKVIDLFKKLKNQIIFTTTLKEEEGEKYSKQDKLNNISFSSHTTNKMLLGTYVERFMQAADEMMVTVRDN